MSPQAALGAHRSAMDEQQEGAREARRVHQ